tara:strand:- start:1508 stop:1951 length:444 start_codon:yes stop_codon:yes gene_type:complete
VIKELPYDTVYEFWKEYLWPERNTILPMSTMRYKDTAYDGILKNYNTTFFGYVINNTVVAVNSGHATSRIHYRSRGLYVMPKYRYNNIGTALLEYTTKLAARENKKYCWSLPRKTALKTYLNAGFEQTSDFFETETSELNCYVIKEL